MQEEYVILTLSKSLLGEMSVKKSFKTYDEAVAFAGTLDYGVTIYRAVAQTKIKHEITKIDENTNNSTRKSPRVPKTRSKLAS